MAKRDPQPQGKPSSAPESEDGGPPAPFAIHEHIGRQLRGLFDEVVTQPVPEKFLKLLDELEQKEAGRVPEGSDTDSE